MNIILFILTVILCVLSYKAIRLIAKRTAVYVKLYRLRKNKKIEIKFTRNPFLTLLKISHAPDIVAKIGNKIYLLRFYNAKGIKYQVHFASKEYSAVFRILRLTAILDVGKALMGVGRHSDVAAGTSAAVKIIPPLDDLKELREREGETAIPILIFNPAPSVITYVSEEKCSIKTAFTGDVFYGMTVFTGSGICDFLERESQLKNIEDKSYSL